MSYNLSACVFIRNSMEGFCLWESAAMILPFVEEFVVLDLGSTDSTIDILKDIAKYNHKFSIILEKEFPEIDAGVFATLANQLIDWCHYENVWYFQADEILHENLISLVTERFDRKEFDLSFWRIQYRENWQRIKWYPHLVHRIGQKGKFNFIGDGMNTDRVWDAKICSNYGGEYFPKWGSMGEDNIKPYLNEMIMDVSLVGGFLENIPERRALHAPFWHETTDIEGLLANQWIERERQNQNWHKKDTLFNIPKIMKYHLGKTRYELRPELLEAIKSNTTQEFLGRI